MQETPAALSSCANSDRSGAAAAADAADARTVLGADVTPSLGDRGRLAIANKGKVGCVGKQRCINGEESALKAKAAAEAKAAGEAKAVGTGSHD